MTEQQIDDRVIFMIHRIFPGFLGSSELVIPKWGVDMINIESVSTDQIYDSLRRMGFVINGWSVAHG